jgi:capsular polysaccharide transport system permease protein
LNTALLLAEPELREAREADARRLARRAEALFHDGRRDEAVACCRDALPCAVGDPATLRICAWVFSNCGCEAEAVEAYCRLAAACPGDTAVLTDAAELLMVAGRVDEAAGLLRDAAPETADPRLFRVLSAAEMLCGRHEAALAAADRAVAGAPDNAEYRLHRGHLQLSHHLAAGRVSEATAAGGALLQRFPDDRGSAEAVMQVLAHRLDAIDGEHVVLGAGAERGERLPRPVPAMWQRFANQRRVVAALIIRETRTRFADAKLGYGWALLEPILHITLLSAVFAVLMHGRPPIGGHFFLFYYTGLIPYLVFVHASAGMSHAIVGNGAVLQLPPVTSFDVVAARGLLEIMTDVVVAAILLAGFGVLGLAALPDDLWGALAALVVTAVFGFGVGFINAALTVFLRSWEKIWAQATRVLYFVSGIFYVPGMMPDWARDILAWNPLLHAIDWFRAGFFATYQPHWLDRSYLAVLAILALLAGLALERGLRRRLSVPL